MMQKKTFVTMLVLLLVLMGRPCYAPTDWVVNVLDGLNNVTQAGNKEIKKIDNLTNEYMQKKIGVLGDFNKLKKAKDKAASAKQRYEKAQAKYKKMQAAAAKAKEKKEALAKRAAEVKQRADKLKQRYDKAMAKVEAAKKKIEEAQAKAERLENKVDSAKGKLDKAKGKLDDAKGKLDKAKGKLDDAKNKYAEVKDGVKDVKGLAAEKISTSTGKISNIRDKVTGTTSKTTEQTPIADTPEMTSLQTQEQTDSTAQEQTVSTIQELTTVAPATTDISLPQEVLSADLQTDVTADNVTALAQESLPETEQTQQIHTQVGLTEQLKQADSIGVAKLKNTNSNAQKTQLPDIGQEQAPVVRRRAFEKDSTVAKEIKDE